MFNLIMASGSWTDGRQSLPYSRFLEYTETYIQNDLAGSSGVDLSQLLRWPCLFMDEGTGDEEARVGQLMRVDRVGVNLQFEFVFDNDVPPLTNRFLFENRTALHMPNEFEFSRNHWAVKNVDLYRFLLRRMSTRRQRPTVFTISEHERVEPTLASAMMPFDSSFNAVYQSIQQAAEDVGMRCRRADDIWENPAIIQDVVALIDRSRIVVCDCTGRNPNVFYEAGIAHTLGREVILLTQSQHDIPFDLRHLRYIPYLNNGEGRERLRQALAARMGTLIGH